MLVVVDYIVRIREINLAYYGIARFIVADRELSWNRKGRNDFLSLYLRVHVGRLLEIFKEHMLMGSV